MKNPKMGNRVRYYDLIGHYNGIVTVTLEVFNECIVKFDYTGAIVRYPNPHLVRLKPRYKAPNKTVEEWPMYSSSTIHSNDPNDPNPAESLINEFNRLRELTKPKTTGLNLIEALKTGKPLRRPIARHTGNSGEGWLRSEYVKHILTQEASNIYNFTLLMIIDRVDLMAEDWEVKD